MAKHDKTPFLGMNWTDLFLSREDGRSKEMFSRRNRAERKLVAAFNAQYKATLLVQEAARIMDGIEDATALNNFSEENPFKALLAEVSDFTFNKLHGAVPIWRHLPRIKRVQQREYNLDDDREP